MVSDCSLVGNGDVNIGQSQASGLRRREDLGRAAARPYPHNENHALLRVHIWWPEPGGGAVDGGKYLSYAGLNFGRKFVEIHTRFCEFRNALLARVGAGIISDAREGEPGFA